jgi:tetratricopeptide (TPR) repeat protein
LAARPDNRRGVGGFAQVEMARGRLDRAISLLADGLARWPGDRTLRLLRAMADLAAGDPEAALGLLNDPVETLLPAELSVRGQALARLEQMSAAVACYAQGKKLQRERYGLRYTPEDYVKKSNTYKSYFTSDRLSALPRAAAHGGPVPVFLLGFPRSGMALLEELLAQLPGFAAGGEPGQMAGLAALAAKLAGSAQEYPAALDDVLAGDGLDMPGQLRARYLAQLGHDDALFVTDRSADNFWHLGLIKLLFPTAPVIHVLRHPLDVMLGNLAQDKKLEANCHASMAAAAAHYDLSMGMIRHYRGQLALRYLPVRYEALVETPAAVLGQVLGFIRGDGAETPVLAGPKIHRRSLYRYRRYEAELPQLFAEVMPVLKPWIDELGYGEGA